MMLFVYGLILALETVVLGGYFIAMQPDGGSLLNVIVGSVGLGSMIVMMLYTVARRSAALQRVMRLSSWLNLHIFLGLQGGVLVLIHSMPMLWKEGGYNFLNPGMINLYAVIIVIGSGFFGRYLFAQVPKTVGGIHMEAKTLEAELKALKVTPAITALWKTAPSRSGLLAMVTATQSRRVALAQLGRMELAEDIHRTASRRITLEFQKSVWRTASRLFRLWIIAHRPIAAIVFLISFVHVVLGMMFSPLLGTLLSS